jgi:hypothetical protein
MAQEPRPLTPVWILVKRTGPCCADTVGLMETRNLPFSLCNAAVPVLTQRTTPILSALACPGKVGLRGKRGAPNGGPLGLTLPTKPGDRRDVPCFSMGTGPPFGSGLRIRLHHPWFLKNGIPVCSRLSLRTAHLRANACTHPAKASHASVFPIASLI